MTPDVAPRPDGQQTVLDVLADPLCQSILQATSDQAKTAAELAELTDSSLSTVYRKLELLGDTSLVDASCRLRSDGKHPRQYRCTVDSVRVNLAGGDSGLSVRVS